MPDTIDGNMTTTNADNGDGTTTTGTTGAKDPRPLGMITTMERDTIYNVDQNPRNADETLFSAPKATVPPLLAPFPPHSLVLLWMDGSGSQPRP
jgi:hypothetical protein